MRMFEDRGMSAADPRYHTTAETTRVVALDGLRGLAALIVLTSHFTNDTGLWHGFLGQGAGQTGVMIFFILSGFLMTRLHIGTPLTAQSLLNYVVRRMARIYPMFVIAAVAYQWRISTANEGAEFLVPVLRQVTLIDPGISVLWTIRIELIFYAVFIALWLVHDRLGQWTLTGLLLLGIYIFSFTSVRYENVFAGTCRYFLFGILSALWAQFCPNNRSRVLSLVGLAMVASMPLGFPLISRLLFHNHVPPWGNNLVALQLILLFNLVIRDRSWLRDLLSNSLARWLGQVSFSLYLVQAIVIDFVLIRVSPGTRLFIGGGLALFSTFAVAGLTNRLFEMPLQKWLVNLGKRSYQDRRILS